MFIMVMFLFQVNVLSWWCFCFQLMFIMVMFPQKKFTHRPLTAAKLFSFNPLSALFITNTFFPTNILVIFYFIR